jgi:hypothetical protein
MLRALGQHEDFAALRKCIADVRRDGSGSLMIGREVMKHVLNAGIRW